MKPPRHLAGYRFYLAVYVREVSLSLLKTWKASKSLAIYLAGPSVMGMLVFISALLFGSLIDFGNPGHSRGDQEYRTITDPLVLGFFAAVPSRSTCSRYITRDIIV
jgi:hypothetical protein